MRRHDCGAAAKMGIGALTIIAVQELARYLVRVDAIPLDWLTLPGLRAHAS